MSGTFGQKQLEVILTLGAGEYMSGGNTMIIRGLSSAVFIDKSGMPSKNAAKVDIAGLARADMEMLTTLAFRDQNIPRNVITVNAGDLEAGVSRVFTGEIISAFADFNAGPDIMFRIDAMTGYYASLTPAPAMTFNGSFSAADAVGTLAGKAGFSFENAGANVRLENGVFEGSLLEQMQAVSRSAGIDLIIDDNKAIISPAGSGLAEANGAAIVLDKHSGLIGYPSFTQSGITARCHYNPALRFGGLVRINSIVPKATGFWRISKLAHTLQNMGETWETSFEGYYVG